MISAIRVLVVKAIRFLELLFGLLSIGLNLGVKPLLSLCTFRID
jgi:hypothetical protein